MKEEGTPFRMVFERRRETSRVIRIPSRITAVSSTAESREVPNPALAPMKNMVMMAMRVGNRPLQGTKLLVMVAIRRSLGESMIRQPTTPAALQPKPIAMVRACLPQVQAFLKYLSRLNATRGR